MLWAAPSAINRRAAARPGPLVLPSVGTGIGTALSPLRSGGTSGNQRAVRADRRRK
jgi:hypothetical protein